MKGMDRFTALADPTRRRIVEMLGQRAMAAGEITAVIPDHAYFDDPVQVGDAVTLAWKPEDAHRLAA